MKEDTNPDWYLRRFVQIDKTITFKYEKICIDILSFLRLLHIKASEGKIDFFLEYRTQTGVYITFPKIIYSILSNIIIDITRGNYSNMHNKILHLMGKIYAIYVEVSKSEVGNIDEIKFTSIINEILQIYSVKNTIFKENKNNIEEINKLLLKIINFTGFIINHVISSGLIRQSFLVVMDSYRDDIDDTMDEILEVDTPYKLYVINSLKGLSKVIDNAEDTYYIYIENTSIILNEYMISDLANIVCNYLVGRHIKR